MMFCSEAPKFRSYLVFSLIECFICVPFTGLIPLVATLQANLAFRQKNEVRYQSKIELAKIILIINITTTVIMCALTGTFIISLITDMAIKFIDI